TGEMKAGDYTVRVDVSDLSSGMYFVTMHSQSYREIKQFILKK
ncbi:T9SS C-terminal target domain-containing protein, partial [Bacteroidetes/Chlorobi group bacterium MS-B_bin-24]